MQEMGEGKEEGTIILQKAQHMKQMQLAAFVHIPLPHPLFWTGLQKKGDL